MSKYLEDSAQHKSGMSSAREDFSFLREFERRGSPSVCVLIVADNEDLNLFWDDLGAENKDAVFVLSNRPRSGFR